MRLNRRVTRRAIGSVSGTWGRYILPPNAQTRRGASRRAALMARNANLSFVHQNPGADIVFDPQSIPTGEVPPRTSLLEQLESVNVLTYESQLQALTGYGENYRELLAKREDIHPNIQLRLTRSRVINTRALLAANSHLVPKVQQVLAEDNNKEVRHILVEKNGRNLTLETWLLLASSPKKRTCQLVASSKDAPEEVKIIAGLNA